MENSPKRKKWFGADVAFHYTRKDAKRTKHKVVLTMRCEDVRTTGAVIGMNGFVFAGIESAANAVSLAANWKDDPGTTKTGSSVHALPSANPPCVGATPARIKRASQSAPRRLQRCRTTTKEFVAIIFFRKHAESLSNQGQRPNSVHTPHTHFDRKSHADQRHHSSDSAHTIYSNIGDESANEPRCSGRSDKSGRGTVKL